MNYQLHKNQHFEKGDIYKCEILNCKYENVRRELFQGHMLKHSYSAEQKLKYKNMEKTQKRIRMEEEKEKTIDYLLINKEISSS